MNKHFLLGAGLALTITFSASSVFAQSLMRCGSLGGKMVTVEKCDAADAEVPICAPGEMPQGGITGPPTCKPSLSSLQQITPSNQCAPGQMPSSANPCLLMGSGQQMQQLLQPCAAGQSPAPGAPCIPSSGLTQQPAQQNQQSLFGQQQQTQPTIITPTVKTSNVTLASKGLKLELKMQSSLNSKYRKAKGRTKKLAAVRSIAKKLPTLCRYISSGDDEADLDEDAFDCDVFVAELSEPIGDALKAKDYEVAYESTIAALESFGEVFESLK
ncbi:hypothetical protein HZC21_03930 [Candidatus Peregrinibacteria bacterium]|nr:hypothetical protein [Candidatus Peregrinibacteria bacterium]